MEENELAVLPPEPAGADSTGELPLSLQMAIRQLLTRRVGLYTMDDSSSVRVETAQELLSSIRFLLSLQSRESGVPLPELLTNNPEEALALAIQTAEQKTAEGKRLYERVCLELPEVENDFLSDTLEGLQLFFYRYNIRYFAHQIPCSIDYPLCLPVPETLEGVCYIREYLFRLSYENRFLRFFPRDTLIRLLTAAYSDYRGLPLNLCAPVLANAAGLALLESPPLPLSMGAEEKNRLLERLGTLSPGQLESALRRAADRLLDALSIQSGGMRSYLTRGVLDLSAHLSLGVELGHLNGLFFSC